jgi:hypothetical protein
LDIIKKFGLLKTIPLDQLALGDFRQIRQDGLVAIENQLWPNGTPKLDDKQSLTAYEKEDGKMVLIDGNHRYTLFKKHGIVEWPVNFIAKEAKLTEKDINRIAGISIIFFLNV